MTKTVALWFGIAMCVLMLIAGCGGALNIDGGEITGNNNPAVISNLTPTEIVVTANTGTAIVPIGAQLHGVRGTAMVYVEIYQAGVKLYDHGYPLMNPLAGGIDINYTARIDLNTNALVTGESGTFGVYMVLSNPTVTSNKMSAVWRVL